MSPKKTGLARSRFGSKEAKKEELIHMGVQAQRGERKAGRGIGGGQRPRLQRDPHEISTKKTGKMPGLVEKKGKEGRKRSQGAGKSGIRNKG